MFNLKVELIPRFQLGIKHVLVLKDARVKERRYVNLGLFRVIYTKCINDKALEEGLKRLLLPVNK